MYKIKDFQEEAIKCNFSTKIGHYSIRNVNKRDEKSKQNSKLISELKRTVRKQNVIVNEVETQREEILTLRAENEKLEEAAEKQNQIQNLLGKSAFVKLILNSCLHTDWITKETFSTATSKPESSIAHSRTFSVNEASLFLVTNLPFTISFRK
jgi:beta-N-acetylglucosaminidase